MRKVHGVVLQIAMSDVRNRGGTTMHLETNRVCHIQHTGPSCDDEDALTSMQFPHPTGDRGGVPKRVATPGSCGNVRRAHEPELCSRGQSAPPVSCSLRRLRSLASPLWMGPSRRRYGRHQRSGAVH